MKHILITTIAAVLLVGCGDSQQSAPAPPDISIHEAANDGNIDAVKQHLAAGTDVNAKGVYRWTPLHFAAFKDEKEIAKLLITEGADVNAKNGDESTPLHQAASGGYKDIVELLIAEGADVSLKK